MAQRYIIDEKGNVVPVKKPPFYKRWWFIVIVVLVGMNVILGFFSRLGEEAKSTDSTSTITETKTTYKTYSVNEVTLSVNSKWEKRDGDKENILYFYPDDSSMMMVGWTKIEESLAVESNRLALLEGYKEGGQVIPVNEKSIQVDNVTGYLYDTSGEIKGTSYKGQMLVVDTPTGFLSIIYMTDKEYTEDEYQEFEEVIKSISISGKTTSPSSSVVASASSSSSTTVQETSDFNPTDSSDATIESIRTYEDYMKMYEFIVNEYISNYENAMAQYGLSDSETYQSIRNQVTETVDQQRAQYGALGNAPIVGRGELVKYLKEYRDQLKTFTDMLSN